uniref:Uncharacterized protein n=1 Tax=Aegilops tauschii subsp. strangulata TaxID=200361 RepID=A0A453P2M3_AEGTS
MQLWRCSARRQLVFYWQLGTTQTDKNYKDNPFSQSNRKLFMNIQQYFSAETYTCSSVTPLRSCLLYSEIRRKKIKIRDMLERDYLAKYAPNRRQLRWHR